MGILKKSLSKVFFGGAFFCFCVISCKQRHTTILQQGSITTNFLVQSLYNAKGVVLGIHPVILDHGVYLAVLEDSLTVLLTNINDSLDRVSISTGFTVNAIATSKNLIYCISDNNQKVVAFRINSLQNIDTIIYPPIYLPDSAFVSSNIHSRIFIINDTLISVPYRIENNSPNYTDTFAYIIINLKQPQTYPAKFVPYPRRFSYQEEFLRYPLLSIDEAMNQYYGFQTSNWIFKFSPSTKKTDSTKIEDAESASFKSANSRDFNYRRSYMNDVDINLRLVEMNKKLVLINKIQHVKPVFYNLYVYDTSLREISRLKCELDLNPEISFVLNDTLYVYIRKSPYRFATFYFSH